MDTIIRQARIEDIEAVVKIHKGAFPDFFLTSLGDRFLKLYYKTVMESPEGILLVYNVDSVTIGFCAGTLLSAGFNTRLIKTNLLAYAIEGAKVLSTKPKALWHLYKNMSKEDSSVGDNGEYAELLSIGVDPNKQGGGAGKKILLALEEAVKEKKGTKLSLTTDFENNEKAIGFYHSLGYQEWYDFVTFPNRKMWRMIKELNV